MRTTHVKARDIVRRDVIALLDDLVDRGAPIQANRTLACVRKMFNYALELHPGNKPVRGRQSAKPGKARR